MPHTLNSSRLDHGFVPGGVNDGLASGEVLHILAHYGISATEEETYQYQKRLRNDWDTCLTIWDWTLDTTTRRRRTCWKRTRFKG